MSFELDILLHEDLIVRDKIMVEVSSIVNGCGDPEVFNTWVMKHIFLCERIFTLKNSLKPRRKKPVAKCIQDTTA